MRARVPVALRGVILGAFALALGCGGVAEQDGAPPPERAQQDAPAPAPQEPTRSPSSEESRLSGDAEAGTRDGRKLRTASGAIVILPPKPSRAVVAPGQGCQARTLGSDAGRRTILFPPKPGISATRLPGDRVRVSYRFGDFDRRCRPALLELVVDESDDPVAGAKTLARAQGREGTVTITIPDDLRTADVVRAIARTRKGLPSDAAAALIR